MQLDHVLAIIGEPETKQALENHWEDSMATLPQGPLSFLQKANWQPNREWCGLSTDVDTTLDAVAARIENEPALRALAWHQLRLLYELKEYPHLRQWPVLDKAFSEGGGAYYLLLGLHASTLAREVHGKRGIPPEITQATCFDTCIVTERYRKITGGKVGLESRNLGWHSTIASGVLHRIGRFEYILRPLNAPFRVYRHRESGAVIALAENDAVFDQEGFRQINGPAATWTATLEETPSTITGTAMSPRGFATREVVTLDAAQWECRLTAGDTVMEIHIPEGEAMTPEACRASFEQALKFFPHYYPENPARAFACYSWILNNQFEEMLPEGSNLLAWQRELYLFPVMSSGKDGLYFVFYQDDIDPATAPRNSTLKRAFIDHLASGRALRTGGMFFLPEDLPHYGTQVYRTQERQRQTVKKA